MAFALSTGPSLSGDSESYLGFARALAHGQIPTSERTPVYPLLIAISEGLGGHLGLSPLVPTLIVQAMLVGVSTALLYGLAHRLTASVAVAVLSTVLFIADADTQNLAGWIMSESLANTLLLLGLWLRAVDGNWHRGGWAVALLVLTRPPFIVLPPLFALVETIRTRTPRAAIPLLGPAAVLFGLWLAVSWVTSAAPSRPVTVFLPRHTFGRIYEFDLWRALPESNARRIIDEERARGADAYAALDRLTTELGPDAWLDIEIGVIRATPIRFASTFVQAIPRSFRQAVLWTPATPGFAFQAIAAWHSVFWGILYRPVPMMFVFGALLTLATRSGFGWSGAREFYRWVGTPFVVGLLGSNALLAMGTDSVGRLALGFRPLYYLAIALCAGRLLVRWPVRRRYST